MYACEETASDDVGCSTSRERVSMFQGGPRRLGREAGPRATVRPVLFCTRFSSSTSEHSAEERV